MIPEHQREAAKIVVDALPDLLMEGAKPNIYKLDFKFKLNFPTMDDSRRAYGILKPLELNWYDYSGKTNVKLQYQPDRPPKDKRLMRAYHSLK